MSSRSVSPLLALIVLASLLCCVTATSYNNKFRVWLPKYQEHFTKASNSCQTELHHYWTNNRTRHHAVCAEAADCLLEHTTETIKANMASASVIFGVMPTVLSLAAPTIAEMSFLSIRYPLLALLLSFATPSINLMHVFGSPPVAHKVVNRITARKSVKSWQTWIHRRSARTKFWIKVAECLIAISMFANNIQAAVFLDQRSVPGWKCGLNFLPFSWIATGGIVHLIGLIAIRLRQPPLHESNAKAPHSYARLGLQSFSRFFVLQSDDWEILANTQDGIPSEILFFVASFAAVGHMLWGVTVFASLLFVSALDTLPIMSRYLVSVVVCQFIVLLELATMRMDDHLEKSIHIAQG